MDLGVTQNDDFFSSVSILSPEEINALLNPLDVTLPDHPSAIQVLLNQGAEVLAQKQPSLFEDICRTWHVLLAQKNAKITAVSEALVAGVLGPNALVCPFVLPTGETATLAFDWTTAYLLIDGMLGGINGLSIEKKQEQPYSEIEKNLLTPLLHQLMTEVSAAFSFSATPLTLAANLPIQRPFEKRFMFSVRTASTVGKMMLSLPQALLPVVESEGLFDSCSEILADIPVETAAVLEGPQMTLKEINEWTVGTMLSLSYEKSAHLVCGEIILGVGALKTKGLFREIQIQEEG